jgi:hypothetical protein
MVLTFRLPDTQQEKENIMHENQTIAEIRGIGVSAIFFSSFGTLWMVLSFHAWGILNFATGLAIAIVAALLLLSAVTLLQSAKKSSSEAGNHATPRAIRWINVTLGVAIAGLCFALSHAHLDAYIPSALTPSWACTNSPWREPTAISPIT